VNLLGIIPQATDFTPGKFATGEAYAVVAPNNMDVLRVAVNQIWIAGKGRFVPNYILMHPTDVASIDTLKIADGRYIEVPYYDPDGPTVVTIPIVQNVGITEGDYLVGDFMRAKAFMRDAMTIRVFDQNADDPIYNRSTVTSNIRLAFRIKNQDKAAFVTGTFATDKAAIASA
jgi:HK97 family phage major capsid protein